MARKPKSAAARAAADLEFDLDTTDLRATLSATKEFSPALARKLRKRLRSTGEEIIDGQRQELSGPPPPGIAATGKRTRLIVPKGARAPYFRQVNVYEERERAGRDYKRGMRRQIGQGLKTRVVAGKTRQGVQVRTDRRKGGEMSQVYQSRIFRHPVFSHAGGSFVHQRGVPYFWGPAVAGRDAAARKVDEALAEAITEMSKG